MRSRSCSYFPQLSCFVRYGSHSRGRAIFQIVPVGLCHFYDVFPPVLHSMYHCTSDFVKVMLPRRRHVIGSFLNNSLHSTISRRRTSQSIFSAGVSLPFGRGRAWRLLDRLGGREAMHVSMHLCGEAGLRYCLHACLSAWTSSLNFINMF